MLHNFLLIVTLLLRYVKQIVLKNGQSITFYKCEINGEMNRARSPPTDAADLSRGCNLNKGDFIIE